MAPATLRVLDQDLGVDCAAADERRIADLAAALNAQLAALSAREAEPMKRLILVALKLLDENQSAGAALVRARLEIDHLTDLLDEARADHA